MLPDDKFCPACAISLEARNVAGRKRPVCPQCGRVVYYDPRLAVISVVERRGKVLMVRRAIQPSYGLWSMPGGYVGRGEVVEEAAAREVQEETGLVVKIDGLVGLFSEAGNPVMVAVFAAHEVGGLLHPGPETLKVGFFPVEELPPLAFPRASAKGSSPKVEASSPFRVSLLASSGCVFGSGRKRTLTPCLWR